MARRLQIDASNRRYWLQIRPSEIQGAGSGLFARRAIPARTVLGDYQGRYITSRQHVYELPDDRYVFVLSQPDRRPLWIDGNRRANYLRFVNGCKTRAQEQGVNVEVFQYAGKLRFRTSRAIPAGTELILDYGPEYWTTYSNVDGIKHRNDRLLREIDTALADCRDARVEAALRGMKWLLRQMASASAYYAFFVEYLWMFYEFRLSRCHPVLVDIASKVLTLELDGAQYRLDKMFKPGIEDKWRFISIIPILHEVSADAGEYARFYRSFFPRSLRYFDASFHYCRRYDDFEGMVAALMDYCFLEMARHGNRRSRLFRLPESRFAEYWRAIRKYDIRALEASVTDEDQQFELDYQVTHLVMCRFGYGSRILAPRSKFDSDIEAYLRRHDSRILEEADDMDLIAELAYCYLEMKIRKRWVQKAIRKILAVQNGDGSWGSAGEVHANLYDRTHQTWTAVTALCHSLANQAS
jgi:hypothetical protein